MPTPDLAEPKGPSWPTGDAWSPLAVPGLH